MCVANAGIVSTVESVVSVGQEVSVRVQSVDGSKLSLTMKEEFDVSFFSAHLCTAPNSLACDTYCVTLPTA
jgi:hypothetical protein